MKYLQLHRLIWILLILIITFIEIIFVVIDYIIYVIWNFKLSFPFKATWKEMHRVDKFTHNEIYDKVKKFKSETDETIKDTIVRRYHYYF